MQLNEMSWSDWVMWAVIFGLLAKLLVVVCSKVLFGTPEEDELYSRADDQLRAEAQRRVVEKMKNESRPVH